jgi:hypothetical protein
VRASAPVDERPRVLLLLTSGTVRHQRCIAREDQQSGGRPSGLLRIVRSESSGRVVDGCSIAIWEQESGRRAPSLLVLVSTGSDVENRHSLRRLLVRG